MRTALIVEDEAVIALDLAAELENRGIEILGIARTHDEALKLLRRGAPDFAIVDLVLNGAPHGARIVEAMRAQGVKVLVVTGSDTPHPVGEGQAVLPKPWHREDLNRAIGALEALPASAGRAFT
jgi:ActR/RegA family two-component response regulator